MLQVRLRLSPGLLLARGERAALNVGPIAPGQHIDVMWHVRVPASAAAAGVVSEDVLAQQQHWRTLLDAELNNGDASTVWPRGDGSAHGTYAVPELYSRRKTSSSSWHAVLANEWVHVDAH